MICVSPASDAYVLVAQKETVALLNADDESVVWHLTTAHSQRITAINFINETKIVTSGGSECLIWDLK